VSDLCEVLAAAVDSVLRLDLAGLGLAFSDSTVPRRWSKEELLSIFQNVEHYCTEPERLTIGPQHD
jgi:hypothetical protein